jgi:lincosamide and streptogramin A transport system ATP-binding/permease protein
MATVSVRGLTFSYEGSYENIFDDASFSFDTDWRLGLVGRNGRGKTTLLQLLLGELPHSGRIDASCGFAYFPFHVEDMGADAHDALGGICPAAEFWELCREASLLGVDESALLRPFGTLSPGERTKLMIAAMFLRENEFLLLDEPTNHLDAEGRESLCDYLSRKDGFLVVSHDRALLDAVTDHTLSINRASIFVVAGNYSVWHEEKTRRDHAESEENEKLRREIEQHRESARRTAGWSDKVEAKKKGAGPVDRGYIGHKSAKLMKRSKTAEARQDRAAERKSQLLKDVDWPGALKFDTLTHHSEILASMLDIAVKYGERSVCEAFCLEVRSGERICLAGGNGSGKSSILRILAGEAAPASGRVRLASGLVVSYIPQAASFLAGSLNEYTDRAGADRTLFYAILRNLGFERHEFENDLASLSEGQKKKILIAHSLAVPAHLYLWDEPLNYVDVISRAQLEDAILSCRPTMVFVEHDEMFRRSIASREVRILSY